MEGKQLSFLTEQVCAKPRKGSMLGKHHSLATKRKMSLSAKNCSKYTTEQRKANAVKMRQRITSASIQKMSRSLTGKPMDMITRQKISSTLKGLITGEQHPMFGKHHTEKAKEKISKASTIHWKDPQIREKQLRAIVEASFIRPTSAEVKLNDILNEVCPNEYLYNGDGGIIIDRCIPDFTNVKGILCIMLGTLITENIIWMIGLKLEKKPNTELW